MIKIDKNEISEEKIFEIAIDAGADDCITKMDIYEIHCDKNKIYQVKKEIEKNIQNFISTNIEWISNNDAKLSKEKKDLIKEFLLDLENDEDVQNVFTNIKFGDE